MVSPLLETTQALDAGTAPWAGAIVAVSTAALSELLAAWRRRLLSMPEPASDGEESMYDFSLATAAWSNDNPLQARIELLIIAAANDLPWALGQFAAIAHDARIDGWVRLRAASEAHRLDPEYGALLLRSVYEDADLHDLVRLRAADELYAGDQRSGTAAYQYLAEVPGLDAATVEVLMTRLGRITPDRAAASLLRIVNDSSTPHHRLYLAVTLCEQVRAGLQIQALRCVYNNASGPAWRRVIALLWLAHLGQEVTLELKYWMHSPELPPVLRVLCVWALADLSR